MYFSIVLTFYIIFTAILVAIIKRFGYRRPANKPPTSFDFLILLNFILFHVVFFWGAYEVVQLIG